MALAKYLDQSDFAAMSHIVQTILPHRGILGVTGDDRISFLQGLVTNDVTKVTDKTAIYSCFLTAQGKFLHDFFIIGDGDRLLIDCEADRRDDLIRRLKQYRLRSNVEIADHSSLYKIVAVWGREFEPDTSDLWFKDPRHERLGWRVISKYNNRLNDYTNVGFKEYDRLRLSFGIPDGSRDMEIEKAILLENNIDRFHGISWDKGCYMGQELTARTKYRGLIKKRLFPVRREGPQLPCGLPLTYDNKEIGEMRSTCGDLGVALIRLDFTQPQICIDKTTLYITALPSEPEI